MPVIHCSVCGQPIRLVVKPDGRTVLVCDCPAREDSLNDIDRLLQSGDLITIDDGK